eukprot:EG_transcript_473
MVGQVYDAPVAVQLLAQMQDLWACDRNPKVWGAVLLGLLSFVDDIVRGKPAPCITAEQGAHALTLLEVLHERLLDVQLQRTVCPSAARSADGILHADQGVFPLFQECSVVPLDEALANIDLEALGVEEYWMCMECGRPSSDPFFDHMRLRHSQVGIPHPLPLCMEDVLHCLNRVQSPYPACTLYSMETPLYKCMNMAMREWDCRPSAFLPWQDFATLLDFELQQIECYTGSVFRAIDFAVPPTLYQKGAVVTWNQPSSASTSPKVAKLFLQGGLGTKPSGTLFILQCHTARLVSSYSLHPEEREVLFRAGTQFQVVGRANDGLKNLLEETMWCTLQRVEVYELRELTLDSWRDVPLFMEPNDQLRNQELLDLIKSLPTHWGTCQRKTKLMCVPMTTLICREHDQATALHLAAAVPHNVACVHLVCARLKPEHFDQRNAEGLTALRVAAAAGHWECVVYLLHRGASLSELKRRDLHRGMPWVCQHASVPLLRAVCSMLAGDGGLAESALQIGLSVACQHRSREVVELFVAAGVQTNALDPEQTHEPPLVACATGGSLENLQLLLEHNADVERDGGWALYNAACNGHVGIVQELLAANVDLQSAMATDGRTALMAASLMGHTAVIAALLAAGDDVHAADDACKTAVMLAAQNDHVTVIEMLLEAKANVQAIDSDGRTALIYAAQGGHVAAIRALLQAGAEVDAVADQDNGRTALMYAAQNGTLPVLQTLFEARADVTATTAEGYTPLMFAARRGHVAAVQALLRARADPHARDSKGRTATIVAAQQGHWAALRVLQSLAEVGQSPCQTNRSNCSSFNSAVAGHSAAGSTRSSRSTQRLVVELPGQETEETAQPMFPTASDLTSDGGADSAVTSPEVSRNVSDTVKGVSFGELLLATPEIRVEVHACETPPPDSPESLSRAQLCGSPKFWPETSKPDGILDVESDTGSSPASLAHSGHSCIEQWEDRQCGFEFDERVRRLSSYRDASSMGRPLSTVGRALSTVGRALSLSAGSARKPSCPSEGEPPRGPAAPSPAVDLCREVATVEHLGGPPSLWHCSAKALGHGPFPDACLGMSRAGRLVAVRQVQTEGKAEPPLLADLERLCALRHPHVVRCFGFHAHAAGLALVLELAHSCLAQVLTHFGRLPLDVARLFTRDVARGLQCLHSQGAAHLNLRPDTILIVPGGCKLLWFPSAASLHLASPTHQRRPSVPQYLAPEALHSALGTEADMWSLGVIVWFMLLGRPVMETTNEVAAMFRAPAGFGIRQIPAEVPSDARAFLQACLSPEPALRATAADLLDAPFLCAGPSPHGE